MTLTERLQGLFGGATRSYDQIDNTTELPPLFPSASTPRPYLPHFRLEPSQADVVDISEVDHPNTSSNFQQLPPAA
jgi:hypothetical protein